MQPAVGFWRLTWKEYRTQRSLWLAVLILAFLVQIGATVIATLTSDAPVPRVVYLVMSFVAVGVYLLGCGATLFALEHEHGTFDFQRLLPVSAWQLYFAKFGVGLVSGAALLAALVFLSHVFFVGWQFVLAPADWLAGAITFAEVFVWSVLFSLLFHHPLRAAICGIVAMTATVCILLPLTNPLPWDEDVLRYHRGFLGARMGIVAILLVLDTWLTWRWFDGKIGLPAWFRSRSSQAADYWLVPAGTLPAYVDARPIGWRRLLWIAWRQGGWVMLLLNGLFLWGLVRQISIGPIQSVHVPQLLIAIAINSAIVFGLCAFTLDQWSNQFRFFAERGADPRWLWLSRQAVWLTPVLVQASIAQWLIPSSQPVHSPVDAFLLSFGLLIFAVMAYSLSQLCAMFIRSTIVALVVSIFAAMMGWCWLLLMLAGNIPLIWSVLPIPVLGLAATWWFSKDWIEERHNRRHWTQVALLFGVPGLAILTGCALFRAYEIPQVDPEFSVSDYTRPMTSTEQETLQLYEEADRLLAHEGRAFLTANQNPREPAQDRERRWLEGARLALPLLERAHERPPVPLTLIRGPSSEQSYGAPEFLGNGNPLGFLLLARLQAESLTLEGKLSEAWRYYELGVELLSRFRLRATIIPAMQADSEEKTLLQSIVRWSAHPQQSKDRVLVALAKLEGLDSQESSRQRLTKVHYVMWSQFLDGEKLDPSLIGLRPSEASTVRWLAALMPWEKARTRRILNLSALANLHPAAAQHRLRDLPRPVLRKWEQTTFLPVVHMTPNSLSVIETQRQATKLTLALVDWHREHEELPETLSELVGPYFRVLPQDPAVNSPFGYFPLGIAAELDPNSYSSGNLPSGKLSQRTPFLWSPLWTGNVVERNDDGTLRAHGGLSELQLEPTLTQGMIWSIPAPSRME